MEHSDNSHNHDVFFCKQCKKKTVHTPRDITNEGSSWWCQTCGAQHNEESINNPTHLKQEADFTQSGNIYAEQTGTWTIISSTGRDAEGKRLSLAMKKIISRLKKQQEFATTSGERRLLYHEETHRSFRDLLVTKDVGDIDEDDSDNDEPFKGNSILSKNSINDTFKNLHSAIHKLENFINVNDNK